MLGNHQFPLHFLQLTVGRGPEIERWFGVGDGTDPAADNDWSFLPFMALSDGAHAWDSTSIRLNARASVSKR